MLLVFQNTNFYSFVIYPKVIHLQVHWTCGVNYSLYSLDCRTALEHEIFPVSLKNLDPQRK